MFFLGIKEISHLFFCKNSFYQLYNGSCFLDYCCPLIIWLRILHFDIGIVNHLLRRTSLTRGTAEYGHAFEHLVIQEIKGWLTYQEHPEQLTYWRTHTGLEVDAVIGDARIAIEIKSVEEVLPRHLKGLKAFSEDYPTAQTIIISLDRINRRIGSIECLYVLDFFRKLWHHDFDPC